MLLDRAIRAYLLQALEAFADAERRDYAEANVRRDVLAVSRFIDFLFGAYQGKGAKRPVPRDGTEGPERGPR
jgi:hypothetical protein